MSAATVRADPSWVEVVTLSGSDTGAVVSAPMDGDYERCAFSGLPHKMATEYADPMVPAWFCAATGSTIYRSHPSKFGAEWIGRWVLKDHRGYTRYRSLTAGDPVPPICSHSGMTWEPYSGKTPEPTSHGLRIDHRNLGPVHQVPLYWPQQCPPADVALVPVESKRLRNTGAAADWSDLLHPSRQLRPAFKPGMGANLPAELESLFKAGGISSAMKVLRIDAVINEPMMRIFAATRAALHIKLGRARTRETWLWHGTNFDNLAKICTSGFDRSFGAVERYGHGCYFARDSKYSAKDRYTPPDAKGIKYMMLCRVIAGEYIVGKSSFTAPMPKPAPRQLENYESFVDDLGSPTIVVTTRDFMAIPEFIFAFVDTRKAATASNASDVVYNFGVDM